MKIDVELPMRASAADRTRRQAFNRALFTRLARAAGAQAWQEGAQVLGQIRNWVLVNLVLGALIIVATQLGSVS